MAADIPNNFTMLNPPPYVPPTPAGIRTVMTGLENEANVFGPLFTKEFIKYGREFAKKILGENIPDDVATFPQLGECMIKISERNPKIYNLLIIAQFHTEQLIQGDAKGVGVQTVMSDIKKKEASYPSIKERNVDIDGALNAYWNSWLTMGTANPEMGYKKHGDDAVDIIWPDCWVKEGCKYGFAEKILFKKVGNESVRVCGTAMGMMPVLRLLTGYTWDHKLIEFNKPYCIVRVFML